MAKFEGRSDDLVWGKYDYSVTRTQKQALDGLMHVLYGLSPGQINRGDRDLPNGGFYSQRPNDGAVLIGIHHRSVTVYRSGRIKSNE